MLDDGGDLSVRPTGSKERRDRRVMRTRAALQRALVSLVREQDYDAITVDDVCRKADVGRSTFYLHFANKDDLKRSGLADLKARLVEGANLSADRFSFVLPLLEHASEHLLHYRALAGTRGRGVSLYALRDIVHAVVEADVSGEGGDAEDVGRIPPEVAAQFLTGAFMGMLAWWLDGGAKLPPETLDAAFRRLAAEGLKALQRDNDSERLPLAQDSRDPECNL